ncbi:MAG: hypothetical protein A2293_14685 [Elusimicrobia bacterium RIFOXYB2_FULL_49_7]|nr:MAG: hypothetical protein A2293_14685 [Elusimicrobia bacterium RIFOXYB2_FULL_49_7]
MTAAVILAVSVSLQLTAAVLALRLIRLTGKWTAWGLITTAILFMVVRRLIPFCRLLSGDTFPALDILNECIGLCLSMLMLFGIAGISPLFTERKRREEALFESEGLLRKAQEIAQVGHFKFHPSTGQVDGSEQFFHILGLTNTVHSIVEIRKIIPLEEQSMVEVTLKKAFRNRSSFDITHSLMPSNGRRKTVRTTGEVLTLPEKGVLLVGTVQDMTERQKTEEELRKVQKLESLGVLAGGIAHDFNNLLGGIFSYIDLAREITPKESRVSEYLDKSLSVFERAKGLTQQLITFSTSDVPIRRTGSLGPLLRTWTEFCLSGSGIVPVFEIDPALKLCDFDENQLGQAIGNIVINARQAMSNEGTLLLSAENICREREEGKPVYLIRIAIRDSGGGIAREILPRIFDPFFTTKPKGNGLGLSTAFSIIRKHDGSLSVESEEGTGTTFFILLPASMSFNEMPPPPLASKAHHGSGRILVMDDEPIILETATTLLQDMGYDVETAINGRETEQKIETAIREGRPFKATILDLTTSGNNDVKQLVMTLKARDHAIVVIVSSGFSENPLLTHAHEHGFNGALQKPYRKKELAELLNQILST